jgi:hypothetical protein
MQGELKPGSHQNIKMTLISSRFPTHFEGEIQCEIDWEQDGDSKPEKNAGGVKSVDANANQGGAYPETTEFIFMRLRKRSIIVI